MTHEQKPESAEFRTREAQVADLAFEISDWKSYDDNEDITIARAHAEEFEARGAAEQRRKDAEGDYGDWLPIDRAPKDGTTILVPVKHIGADVVLWDLNGWRETTNMLLMRDPPTHWMPLPSFPSEDRPANVAALEARVKELEGALRDLADAIRTVMATGMRPGIDLLRKELCARSMLRAALCEGDKA